VNYSLNKNKINSTTNAIESINLQLKRSCSYGKISFHAACEILVQFKSSYRSQFEEKVLRLNLNRRKPQALENNSMWVVNDLVEENALEITQL
jgi:hypothetical protein